MHLFAVVVSDEFERKEPVLCPCLWPVRKRHVIWVSPLRHRTSPLAHTCMSPRTDHYPDPTVHIPADDVLAVPRHVRIDNRHLTARRPEQIVASRALTSTDR